MPATPVNPSTTPVQVVVQVPAVQAITVKIIRVDTGAVVGTLGPVNAMAGPTTIPWSGGRGPGGTGPQKFAIAKWQRLCAAATCRSAAMILGPQKRTDTGPCGRSL